MAERRQALLIACEEFVDPHYKCLSTPVRDARAFAKILEDPEIGQFSVELLENASREAIVDKLEGFFEGGRPDDVLLLYLAGHGDLDERQKFYFVAHDTPNNRLLGKGVADHLIHEAMVRSLCKRQILILDCCYSGAISKDETSGWISRGDASAGIKHKLTGEGRVVLTASDMLEYAYEKRSASGEVKSLFTSRLVEGIEGGDADLDGDGFISVDELYNYVEERIRQEDPSQKPKKFGGVYGQLWVGRAVPRPNAIPRGIIDLLNHPYPTVRLAGIEELRQRLSANPVLYLAAVQALNKMRADADATVQLVASTLLERIEAEQRQREEQERLQAERRAEAERLELERRQQDEEARLKAERQEQERLEAERRQREEQERLEAERKENEQREIERHQQEEKEQERLRIEQRLRGGQERIQTEAREQGPRELERHEEEGQAEAYEIKRPLSEDKDVGSCVLPLSNLAEDGIKSPAIPAEVDQAAPKKLLAALKKRPRLLVIIGSGVVILLVGLGLAFKPLRSHLRREWFAQAERYLDAKDYARALPPLQMAAYVGNAEAAYELAGR
jgi:flagellar biosynthesis GTPase FlhF